MNSWLKQVFFNIRHSYWFIPSILALLSIVAAAALVAIDLYWFASVPAKYKWLFETEPQGARAILSTVAGSTITVAGVVFSMTMMSVSHTTSTYGPRLLLNFLKDTKNQITLGVFIATFIYCLLVLRTVQGGGVDDPSVFVPHIAVFGALGMALLSVAVLIGFLHHIPESINIGNVVADRGHELITRLEEIFTEDQSHKSHQRTPKSLQKEDEAKLNIYTKQFGYVQVLDYCGLVEFCQEENIVVSPYKKPGDFVAVNEPLLFIHCIEKLDDNRAETLPKALTSFFAIGRQRTPAQDVGFVVEELCQVAARALSPGVNDPFTAISCLDWLSAGLSCTLNKFPSNEIYYDDDGNQRVVILCLSFKVLCEQILGRLMPYVIADYNASLHMASVLQSIIKCSPSAAERELLRFHAQCYVDEFAALSDSKESNRKIRIAFESILNQL